MMATVHKLKAPDAFDNITVKQPTVADPSTHMAIVKGAPDKLFQWISYLVCQNKTSLELDTSAKITKSEMDEVSGKNLEFAKGALRCLACCIVPLTDKDMMIMQGMKDAGERLDFLIGASSPDKQGR